METIWNTVVEFFKSSGIAGFFVTGGWANLVMIVVALILLFLAIKKDFEPYLLLPIAFGMLLVNLPLVGQEIFNKGATGYNAIQFAAKAGLTDGQVQYIFSQLGNVEGIYTTHQISDLVSSSSFLVNAPAELGFTSTTVNNIKNVYNYDYSGMFGYLYYGVKWGIYPCLIFPVLEPLPTLDH